MPRLKNGRQQARKKKQKAKKRLVVAMVSKTSLRSQAAKQNKEKESEQEAQSEGEAINLRPKRSKPQKRLIEEEAQKKQVQKKQPAKKSPAKKGKKKAKPKVTPKSKGAKRKSKAVDDVTAKKPKLEEVEEMLTEFDGIHQSYEELQECEDIETLVVATNPRQRTPAKGKPTKQKRARIEKNATNNSAQIIIESVPETIPKPDSEDDEDVPEEDDDDIDDSLFFGIPTEKSPDFGNCSHCKKKFRREELTDHINNCPERYVQCRECNKVLSNLQTLERHHKRFHLKLREVPCTLCDKMFIDEAAARKHLKTVHFKVKNFHCPHCDKSFSQRNKLTYHVRTHSGEKPFACTECGRSFSLLWNLKTHLRTHTGEKPYACDTCGRKFTQKQNMTSHMTTHKKPKIARSSSYVTFSSSDNLDYFSMSELRQSAKASMVNSNQNTIKFSQTRGVGQGAQYLINQLGNLSSSVTSDAENNASVIAISQNNDLENGLGLLSSVARKGENAQDGSGSVEVDCIVDEAHLSNQVGHGADQVVEVLVQPQGGNGDPTITFTTSDGTSHGTESFVSTSRVESNAADAYRGRDASNMVSASVATLQQQHQAVGAQNVIPIGNANLSGLANILQNPEVLSAINAAAASNKFIVIGPVGMLSGQNAGSTNTVSIATAYSNDGVQAQQSFDSEAVANFVSSDMMTCGQSQSNQPLMEIAAVDHLDSTLAASCDVEMIPADTSQDASIQFADATSREASNEVQSTVSSVMSVMIQGSSTVAASSTFAADPTSSVHSYAITSEPNRQSQVEASAEEAEVVSSQDGVVEGGLHTTANAGGEQVSSSEENQIGPASNMNQADSSKDKETVQSSSGVAASSRAAVFDVNIASSYMTDDKLVTQSTDNSASNISPTSQIMNPYSAQPTASGDIVSAQTEDGSMADDGCNVSQSYIVTLGDQFVSSSTRTSALANSSFITSSGLSGTGQSMVMVTADGQSYFTTLTLPEGFQQSGTQQIILADSMASTFNIPVVNGPIALDSLASLQPGDSTANSVFAAQFQNDGNEVNVDSGSDVRVEQVPVIEESTVTDSTARIVANSNTLAVEQPNSSLITESDLDASVSGSNQIQQPVGNSFDDQVNSNVDTVDSNHDFATQASAPDAYAPESSANDFTAYQQAFIDAADLVSASSTANYDGVVSGTENITSPHSIGSDQLEAQRTGVTSSNLLDNNAEALNVSSHLSQADIGVEQEESYVSTSLQ